jgi:methylmalonyl-CoA mutase
MQRIPPYKPSKKLRIVTAASLFDGHDAAINIMRRIIQASGVEVIHLGHDRSVEEVVNCAIQEDAHAIALTSYQGGHNEYFKYMYDLLEQHQASHIKIFGGGGGVILPEEIEDLMKYGISRIYSPDDGRRMGLQGMINDLLETCDNGAYDRELPTGKALRDAIVFKNPKTIAELITMAENEEARYKKLFSSYSENLVPAPVLGITGTGGSGKSSTIDELVRRYLADFPDKTIALVSVDPSKRKTGGALLGDRIRMNAINNPRVYMRSLATRQANLALSKHVHHALDILSLAGFDLIILETSGIGQSDTEILDHSDVSLYVMTPDYGAATQLEKIDMIDFADVIALNKFDKRGALDALRDVRKQYQRNHERWEDKLEDMPVFGTVASQFNDPGTNALYKALLDKIDEHTGGHFKSEIQLNVQGSYQTQVIPPNRTRYLSEISENNRAYSIRSNKQRLVAQRMYGIFKALETLTESGSDRSLDFDSQLEALLEAVPKSKKELAQALLEEFNTLKLDLDPRNWELINSWPLKGKRYSDAVFSFEVRGKKIEAGTRTRSMSGLDIPKIALPRFEGWGDILFWLLEENVPGEFPFTAGIYPFKRVGEDPTRMFAGEGSPERTNRRFHYVSLGMEAKRLSTAFDSVTLYGNDPDERPDIYGKIGNSGVSVCCLDDAKKLYSGFDLSDPTTSVSMTINGPAPIMLAYFMNVAIDQSCEKYIRENDLEKEVTSKIKKLYQAKGIERPSYSGPLPEGNDGLGLLLLGVTGDQVLPAGIYKKLKNETMARVRGTIQADILKEDQAQNTCIFSTEFALRMMGDVQQYFINRKIRNFYSVSISGYHIAEAGANPISQLAFTLANGFTYVEYYLSRGMDINAFGPNLSFFFSNGVDAEYAVIGRVARKIWSKAMKHKYGANPRAQMLKYHIQTSGRSLHAQEIDFNDIRTTLQALYAIYDNCNSLHTNAYDEAITTPTEESVRRAMAIQLIINKELGLNKNENTLQGSYIIEELTDLVEEAVYAEFDRLTERGGVLGAMETMYQRGKIQEESLHYESMKHTGELPIVGVNTFLSSKGSPTIMPLEVIRATEEEKKQQIELIRNLHKSKSQQAPEVLQNLSVSALNDGNIFDALMEATKICSIGQITQALFEVGGQYRRNM